MNFDTFMKSVVKTVDENLPAIEAVAAMIFEGLALPAGVYAGMKTNEELQKLPEDATFKDKFKAVWKYYIPVVGFTVGAEACTYASHKEHTKRYVAIAGTLALTQKDNKYLQQFKEKAEEKLGIEKTEEVKKEVAKQNVAPVANQYGITDLNKPMWFKDTVTGFPFQSTLLDIERTEKEFNELDVSKADNDDDPDYYMTMADFYKKLLPNYDPLKAHEDLIISKKAGVPYLYIDKTGMERAADMTPIGLISYKAGNYMDLMNHSRKPLYTDLGYDVSY